MRKKILSVLLVFVLGFACSACNINNKADNNDRNDVVAETSDDNVTELEVLKSDFNFTPEETLSKIKQEYLITNNGYSDDDEIAAILVLTDKSLVENFNEGDGVNEKTVADYASGWTGTRYSDSLSVKQKKLIDKLFDRGLISEVRYTYTTIANAVAVTTTYGNFKEIEKYTGTELKQAVISDTYARVQATQAGDGDGRVTNVVDVYETGIYNSGSVSYTGKGTAVAVLDSGFDISHNVFSYEPLPDEVNGYLIEKEDVETLIEEAKNKLASPDYREGVSVAEDQSKVQKKLLLNGVMNAVESTPDLIAENVYHNHKVPFAYDYADKDYDVFPYDSEHGTHVAGIIGGWYEPEGHKGVAKDTQLVLMKVFPDLEEGAQSDDILAALEDSVILGVDAINMSLGSSCGFAREPDGDFVNDVYDAINDSGISLVTAASNNYTSGYGGDQGNTSFVTNPDSGTVGAPSTYAAALSVASISGTMSHYLYANDKDIIYFNESNSISGKENHFFDELFSDIESGGAKYNFNDNRYDGLSVTTAQDGNKSITLKYVTVPGIGERNSYRNIDVKGKIALVRRGDNSFEDKALQAKNAGAIGCIIYNNIDGDILMSMGKTDHIPTVSISKDDGTLLAAVNEGTLLIDYSNAAGPFMSDFSSWGPMPDLGLKPDITAHGGNIRSSMPGGGYEELSGTSMASPNMCGVVVLIRQYLKGIYSLESTSWKDISVLTNEILMSTSTIALNEQGNPYSPRKQGAGLASISNVVNTKGFITVDNKDRAKIELGDDPKKEGVYEMEFNIMNMTSSPVTYDLSLVGMSESVSSSDVTHIAEKSHMLSNNFTAEMIGGNGSVSGNRVTVNGSDNVLDPEALNYVKVKVIYTISQEDKDYIDERFPYGMYVEGFVKLEQADDGDAQTVEVDLSLPFLAFYGDWTKAPVFDKTYYEVESEAHNAGIDEEDKIKADYYATTPYGWYMTNYGIPFGTYLYDVDTSMYDPIPASTEHAAVSDERGALDGFMAVFAGCLRNVKFMRYTITDKASGEVVLDYLDKNAMKAYSNGASPVPSFEYLEKSSRELGLVNNRQYEFKMQAMLDYDVEYDENNVPVAGGGLTSNVRNTFSFDFYMDNEAPTVRDAKFRKEYDETAKKDRYYIDLTVYDNHYVQAVYPMIFTADSYTFLTDNPIPVYGDRGEDATVSFEVTDFLDNAFFTADYDGYLGFNIADYALNTNIYLVRLPGTRGNFTFTKDGSLHGEQLDLLNMMQDEVIDLVQYLAITDVTTAEGTNTPTDDYKDYLQYLSWSSSEPDIARVERGQVLGLKPGIATITVRSSLTRSSASLQVWVRQRPNETATTSGLREVPVSALLADKIDDVDNERIESIRFVYFDTEYAHLEAGDISEIGETGERTFITASGNSVSFYPGERIKLKYEIKPWYVADKYNVVYQTSNSEIATVDENGVVTALKEGTARITAAVENSNLQARLSITVKSEFIIENRILVAYKGLGGDVVIPDDEGIMYVGPYAFCLYSEDEDVVIDDDIYANRIPSANNTVRSVVIPEGVEQIQRNAFYNCTALESVTFTDDMKFIREYAFDGCVNLQSINNTNAGNTLLKTQAIGMRAFADCEKLTQLDLSKVLSLGVSAFENSAITSADLTSLRNASANVFANCKGLQSVTLDVNGNTKLSEGMFRDSGLQSIDIYSKTGVPANCFYNCGELTSATIHSLGSPQIGSHAFAKTGLEEITLPDEAVTLGTGVFDGCASLATVKLQANTLIGSVSKAFTGTGVTRFEVAPNGHYSASSDGRLLLSGDKIVLAAPAVDYGVYEIDGSYAEIGESAFAGANITQLNITNKDLKISDYAFADCANLEKVVFPAQTGNLTIGAYAFAIGSGSGLVELDNIENVKSIGNHAFENAAVTSLTLGENATVGDYAFNNAALVNITLGSGDKLGSYSFAGCASLTTVNMPQAGVVLGDNCFSDDVLLNGIDLSGISVIPEGAFYNCSSLAAINLINVTDIGAGAFSLCKNLKQVNNVTKLVNIGDYAFSGNIVSTLGQLSAVDAPSFASINLPATVRKIGNFAFAGNPALTSVTIGAGVTELGDYAFAYCTALTTASLSADVKKLGDFAFAGCTNLTTVNLGSVEEIGMGAFADDAALSAADLAKAVKIGEGSFNGCAAITQISAPLLVEAGNSAFADTGLVSVEAPLLARIGEYAFSGAPLTEFVFSDNLEYVGAAAFAGCTDIEKYYRNNGGTKTADGEINSYALLEDGVLYTRIANGRLALNSVPAAYDVETFTVIDGTIRILRYAGNENKNISKIVLPDGLASIENFAFYGYDNLTTVEFRSAVAPTLENFWVSESSALSPSDPGYGLVHGAFEFSNLFLELDYYNFVTLMGKINPLTMILPANADLEGYEFLAYKGYFGEVADAQRSEYVAMEKNMRLFIDYAKKIAKIEEISLNDEEIVVAASSAYNAIKQNYADYGYSEAEWNAYVKSVNDAKATIAAIKKANMSKIARDIQARIDALPSAYDGSAQQKEIYEQLTYDINSMRIKSDIAALDLTRYNAYKASYESYNSGSSVTTPTDPQNPDNPNEPSGPEDPVVVPPEEGSNCSGCGSTTIGDGLTIGGIALMLACVAIAATHLRRKRSK